MIELDKLVGKHLTLTQDGKCDKEGHELISRACVHCGLTIHQISDANDHTIPLRDTPAERAERLHQLSGRLRTIQREIVGIKAAIEAIGEIDD